MGKHVLAVVAALVTGCATHYTYVPEKTAARAAPVLGDVSVALLGVGTVKSPHAHDWKVRALHVRMVVRNRDREEWTLEPFRQIGIIDSTREAPEYVVSDGTDDVPLLVLLPGDTRVVDLYYPLPARAHGVKTIPTVTVDWRLSTATGPLGHGESAFDRQRVQRQRQRVFTAHLSGALRTTLSEEAAAPRHDDLPHPDQVDDFAGASDWRD
jgi:hypothetical protein